MKNNTDVELSIAAIKSRLGDVLVDCDTRAKLTPMSVVLDVADPHLVSPLRLFWVDEGWPGHFVLAGSEGTDIVFHTRYLVLSRYIQKLFRPNIQFDGDDLCERALLRFAAEFFLYAGTKFTDQSIQTLARSRLGCSIYFLEPTVNCLLYARLIYVGKLPILGKRKEFCVMRRRKCTREH